MVVYTECSRTLSTKKRGLVRFRTINICHWTYSLFTYSIKSTGYHIAIWTGNFVHCFNNNFANNEDIVTKFLTDWITLLYSKCDNSTITSAGSHHLRPNHTQVSALSFGMRQTVYPVSLTKFLCTSNTSRHVIACFPQNKINLDENFHYIFIISKVIRVLFRVWHLVLLAQ